jgi:phosphatidyl-myo-inositol dimannoside synthase
MTTAVPSFPRRALVLAGDPAGTGGIERATRTLLMALGDLLGSEHVELLPIWRRLGLEDLRCRVLPGGEVVRTDPPGSVRLATRLRFARAAVKASVGRRTDTAVFACHPAIAPVALMCRLVAGVPYAVWCHGYDAWAIVAPLERLAVQKAARVFAPSEFSARLAEQGARLPASSVRVIPHCLPPELHIPIHDPAPSPKPTVLTVARLASGDAYKGVDSLLQVWANVRRRVATAELVIVGDGSDRRRLEAMAASSIVDGSVRFLGQVTDMELERLYGGAAVFALPARVELGNRPGGEGFGIVLLEAAAAGLPVVACDDGPTPEVVVNGRTGLLVHPGDEAALADALVELLEDPVRRRRMGEAAIERVAEHYSYEAFRVKVATLLEELDHPTRSARLSRYRLKSNDGATMATINDSKPESR